MIPEPLLFIIPLVCIPIAGYLNSDGLPEWINRLITLAIILIFSFLAALFDNALGGDFLHDALIIIGYTSAVMVAAKPLTQWFTSNTTSPLAYLMPNKQQPPAPPAPASVPDTTSAPDAKTSPLADHQTLIQAGEASSWTQLHQAVLKGRPEVPETQLVSVPEEVKSASGFTAGLRLKLPYREAGA